MTPRRLCLLMGPLLLCTALLAAPHTPTSRTPPRSSGDDPEMHRQDWARPGNRDTKDGTEKETGPVGLEGAALAKRGGDPFSKGTGPPGTERAPQDTKAPKARGGLVGKRESGPLEDPRPLGTEGADHGKTPLSGGATSLRDFLSKMLAKLGCLGHRNATSGETPGPDGKAASNHSQHGQPLSGNTSAGNTTHGKPICGGKPGTSGAGHGAHGKTPKPAPHEKPEKPKTDDDPKKDDDDDAGEKDLPGDDHDDGEDDDNVGGDTGKGSDDADEDAFDKELDYGLDKSPFNAYAYHDAWSDDDDDSEEEEGGFPEESLDFGVMKTFFDVWGDLLTKPKPEEEVEGVGYNGERPTFDIWGDIVRKPKPEA